MQYPQTGGGRPPLGALSPKQWSNNGQIMLKEWSNNCQITPHACEQEEDGGAELEPLRTALPKGDQIHDGSSSAAGAFSSTKVTHDERNLKTILERYQHIGPRDKPGVFEISEQVRFRAKREF